MRSISQIRSVHLSERKILREGRREERRKQERERDRDREGLYFLLIKPRIYAD